MSYKPIGELQFFSIALIKVSINIISDFFVVDAVLTESVIVIEN